jgi:hypothetical protein
MSLDAKTKVLGYWVAKLRVFRNGLMTPFISRKTPINKK